MNADRIVRLHELTKETERLLQEEERASRIPDIRVLRLHALAWVMRDVTGELLEECLIGPQNGRERVHTEEEVVGDGT